MCFEVPDSIKAKHVFGELTLGDIWPLVSVECASVTLEWEEMRIGWRITESRPFFSWEIEDSGLRLLCSHEPFPFFPWASRVVAKDNRLRAEFKGKVDYVDLLLCRADGSHIPFGILT